jgi:PadR family transcriptional regulator PadR
MGKRKPELPQGTLDMLVLKAVSLGQMHGYGVGQRIGQLAEKHAQGGRGPAVPGALQN